MLKLLQKWLLKTRMEVLSLKDGDILLVERAADPKQQFDAILQAGKAAGLMNVNIPIVFVDNINGYQVEELTKLLQAHQADAGQRTDAVK